VVADRAQGAGLRGQMWVKICANTNVEDALAAVELGADAVGFVFAPSKRQVSPAQVARITRELPRRVERVGVFGAGSVEEIALAVEEAGLNAVQMHGGVDLEFADKLARRLGPAVQIVETLHWSVEQDAASSALVFRQLAAVAAHPAQYRVLIDAKVGSSNSGGTGRTFNWSKARSVLSSQPELRVIVAGGLDPDNVAEAIRVLRPWGVDVASGVESEPGRKDHDKLRRFIENARGAV
jgi:phosphoribosylanthranilate isomerase